MSKLKYYIINGDRLLGTFWETENLGNVLVMESKVDFNNPLEIYTNTETEGFLKVSDVDIIEDFLEILNYNLKKEGLE